METTTAPLPVVVVLGFHRSGTSMVTRMLNLLGVDLGDQDALLPAIERDNARGYWEPRWMIELNEELLAALGSGTFEPFRPEPGWERSPALEPLRERARTLLAEHFGGSGPLWGWKDPRTSLTLPFWRALLDAPLRCVICVRSPADAVASALKRGVPGVERWTYAERWLDYVAGALEATDAAERMLVFYEDALRDPAGEARRLAAFLDLEEPDDDALAPVVESVDAELRHHRSSAWDVAVDAGLPLEARVLYLALRARRLTDGGERDGERLADALEHVAELQRDARRELLHANSRADAATARAEAAESQIAELRERLAELERQRTQLAQDRDGLDDQVEELRIALQARDDALAAITGSRSWRLTEPLRRLGGGLPTR